MTFKAKIELVESLGAEDYAYFEVEGIKVDSDELNELAVDSGAHEVPSSAAGAGGGAGRRGKPDQTRPGGRPVAGHHEAPLLRPLRTDSTSPPSRTSGLAPTVPAPRLGASTTPGSVSDRSMRAPQLRCRDGRRSQGCRTDRPEETRCCFSVARNAAPITSARLPGLNAPIAAPNWSPAHPRGPSSWTSTRRAVARMAVAPAGASSSTYGTWRWVRVAAHRERLAPERQRDSDASASPLTAKRARRSFLSNLPTEVLGTSSMNSKRSGIHHLGTRSARCARSPSASTSAAGAADDAGAWPLPPALVGNRDHGGLDDVGVGNERVLELDRRDPFTARLDEVLRAVDEPDERAALQLGDVAGAQPSVVGEPLVAARVRVVGARDHGPRTCSSPPES